MVPAWTSTDNGRSFNSKHRRNKLKIIFRSARVFNYRFREEKTRMKGGWVGGGRSSGENGRRYRDRFSVDKSKQSIKIFDEFFPSFFLSFFCSVFGVLVGKSLSRRRYRSEGHSERERKREKGRNWFRRKEKGTLGQTVIFQKAGRLKRDISQPFFFAIRRPNETQFTKKKKEKKKRK